MRTTAGAIGTRLSLRPLFLGEGEIDANLGRIAPRERERVSSRCLKFEFDGAEREGELMWQRVGRIMIRRYEATRWRVTPLAPTPYGLLID